MTASCPGRETARSRCGTRRAVSASGRCTGTRATRGVGVQSTQRVDRSSTSRRAQVSRVAVLPNGRVVSGRYFVCETKVWDVSTGKCLRTLRKQGPYGQHRATLRNGNIVTLSGDTLKVCEDVEVKKMMAHFVARHRLHEMNVAGRLIAEFF